MNILNLTDDETLRRYLVQHYQLEHQSATDIGERLGVTGRTILRYLEKFHIPVRKRSAPRLGARKSGLHNVPIDDWRLGITGVTKKYGLDYTSVYNFYHRYKEEIDEALRELKRRSRNN